MESRQNPFCIEHFLGWAQEAFTIQNKLSSQKSQIEETQSAPSTEQQDSPTQQRVQPRRQAKSKVTSYAAVPVRRRKTNVPSGREAGASKKQAGEQSVPSWDSVKANLRAVIIRQEALARETEGCIFGPRPWVCPRCQEDAAPPTTTADPEQIGPAPMACMIEGPELPAELASWEHVHVPPGRTFGFAGHLFTVDACNSIMILRL